MNNANPGRSPDPVISRHSDDFPDHHTDEALNYHSCESLPLYGVEQGLPLRKQGGRNPFEQNVDRGDTISYWIPGQARNGVSTG